MKAIIQLIIPSAVIILTSACGGKQDSTSKSVETNHKELIFSGKESIEAHVAAIDNDQELVPANSLMYSHPDGSTAEATAYLDQKETIMKIEERFNDAKTGNFGRRIFYFENGKRILTKEIYQDNTLKKPAFVERQSFYDKNDKIQYSQVREAEFEENLEMCTFRMTEAVDCPVKRAMQILNQEGPFATTFQGFVSGGDMDFLIVGEDVPEGYTSSLAIQHKEGDIQKLLANQRAYVGKKLKVQFERMVDHRDMEFQVLLALSID
jgi:hypothetical protein